MGGRSREARLRREERLQRGASPERDQAVTDRRDAVRFGRSVEVLSRRVGAEVLVTTPGDAELHELTGGASAVWRDLDVPRTRHELVDRLAAEHDVEPSDIEQDVTACLDTLRDLGVVVESGEDIDG